MQQATHLNFVICVFFSSFISIGRSIDISGHSVKVFIEYHSEIFSAALSLFCGDIHYAYIFKINRVKITQTLSTKSISGIYFICTSNILCIQERMTILAILIISLLSRSAPLLGDQLHPNISYVQSTGFANNYVAALFPIALSHERLLCLLQKCNLIPNFYFGYCPNMTFEEEEKTKLYHSNFATYLCMMICLCSIGKHSLNKM